MRLPALLLLLPSCSPSVPPAFLSSVRHAASGQGETSRLTTSSSPPVLGERVEVTCRAGHTVTSCLWGLEGEAGLVQGVKEGTSCSLVLPSLTEREVGRWRCRVEVEGGRGFQEEYIQLGTTQASDLRLPTHLVPLHYDIFALPFIVPDNWTIAGLVEISLEVKEAADNVTLHLHDITVHEEEVRVGDVPVVGHGYDEERQFYVIHLGEKLPANSTVLVSIPYTGNLNGDLVGFYRSSYTDSDTGALRWIATTQFETTDARRAFPCMDEPGMKAVFRVQLGRLPDMSTISNMPLLQEGEPIDGTEYVLDTYEESLRMSTYLVAFVVSDFVYRESPPLENGVTFRIWSRPGAYSQTEYAAEIGPRILQFYEGYFNTSYPLPKQDMIAIPDFAAGAMENWGLITYREYAILYEEGVSSAAAKETVAATIAHELAHQWFGDLVTMEWWTDLWLNEGFAAYTEGMVGTDHVLPDAGFPERFLLFSLQPALLADSLLSSHPISVEVNDPSEINQIFDTISYQKGSSVIRMMANFLGIDTFNRGIANYLHGNAFGNANQDDLWSYLTTVAVEDGVLLEELTVKEVMDTWTLQTGYPLVSVAREGGSLSLRQDRFLLSPGAEAEEESYWWVPVSYCRPGEVCSTAPSLWLPPVGDTLTLEAVTGEEVALVLNVKQTGFYRVNYDQGNWGLIAEKLLTDHSSIDTMNRAQLLDDAFNVAKAGLLEYRLALDLTLYLGGEEDYLPWQAALTNLDYLAKMLRRTAGYGAYQSYLLGAIQPLYARLGYDEVPGEPVSDSLLRVEVLQRACGAGLPDCVARSLDLLHQWMAEEQPDLADPVPAHARATALCTAIAASDSSAWQFVYQRYLASSNPGKKITFLEALACSREDWVLERYLAISLQEEAGVKKQDGYRVIASVAGQTLGRYVAWNWVRANWSRLAEYFDTGLSTRFKIIVSSVAEDFNTAFDLKELEEFIEENREELGSAEDTALQMVELTEGNVLWMEEHYGQVLDWLEEQ